MTLVMPMTRSERLYYAILRRNSARGGKRIAVPHPETGRLVRTRESLHMTAEASMARRICALVSRDRWH